MFYLKYVILPLVALALVFGFIMWFAAKFYEPESIMPAVWGVLICAYPAYELLRWFRHGKKPLK